MKRVFLALLILIPGLFLSLFPYNMYQEKKNLDSLNRWLNHQQTKMTLFEEDIVIIDVVPLGSDIYRLKAEDSKLFLVYYKQENLHVEIKIYNEGNILERFGHK